MLSLFLLLTVLEKRVQIVLAIPGLGCFTLVQGLKQNIYLIIKCSMDNKILKV